MKAGRVSPCFHIEKFHHTYQDENAMISDLVITEVMLRKFNLSKQVARPACLHI